MVEGLGKHSKEISWRTVAFPSHIREGNVSGMGALSPFAPTLSANVACLMAGNKFSGQACCICATHRDFPRCFKDMKESCFPPIF